MENRRLTQVLEFWCVILLPWIFDVIGGREILATLFGALLWGIAVALAAARSQTRDPKFRVKQGWALAFIAGSWVTYWGLSFAEAPRKVVLQPESTKWLTWLHAGLLTAGLGLVLVLGLASLMWLIQDHLLRKSSWERRRSRVKLPSLEALSSVCDRSVRLAFSMWGLGFFLALMTAMLRWAPTLADGAPSAWWLDTKVLTTALLWIALAAGFQLSLLLSKGGRWLYRGYFGLSVGFILFFTWFLVSVRSAVHESLSWFV